MKIYKITQDKNVDYDTYDAAIVVAETISEARQIQPSGDAKLDRNEWCHPDFVSVEYIGEARPDIPKGVVLASFNAG